MDRKIEFKGKCVANGKWIKGSLAEGVFFGNGKSIPYILNVDGVEYDDFYDLEDERGYYEVNPETLCQFTGMMDRNGKEIWEHDVLRAVECEELCYVEVVWHNGCWCCEEKGFPIMCSVYDSTSVIEVVGNIFDNPEFIEEAGHGTV